MIFKKIYNFMKNILFPKSQLEILKKNGLKYGKNFSLINSSIDFGHAWLVEIGDDVTITNSVILSHDASMKKFLGKSKIGKVKIGNRVFIGYKSIVLCNVNIGDDVIIGAGSVVTHDIPSNSIVVGNPARIIGKTSDFLEKHKNNMKTKKVYSIYWKDKTDEEKEQMKKELENDFGYDE